MEQFRESQTINRHRHGINENLDDSQTDAEIQYTIRVAVYPHFFSRAPHVEGTLMTYVYSVLLGDGESITGIILITVCLLIIEYISSAAQTIIVH